MNKNKLSELIHHFRNRLVGKIHIKSYEFLKDFPDKFAGEAVRLIATRGTQIEKDDTIYPDGTKYFYRNKDSALLLIEHKPQVRSLSFTFGEKPRYRLALPYLIFGLAFNNADLTFNGACVAYSKKSIKSLDDMIFSPNLPNTTDFNLCHSLDDYDFEGFSIGEQASILIADFWDSSFGTDWPESWFNSQEKYSHFETLETWEKASAEDPLFIVNMDWQEKEISVQEFLGKLVTGNSGNSDIYHVTQFTASMIHDITYKCSRVIVENDDSLDKWFLDELLKEIEGK